MITLLSACGDGHPSSASPQTIDVTGRWTAPLPIRTPEGDWSSAELTLTQNASDVEGEMVSRDGVSYPLLGTVTEDELTLVVGNLPGTSTCAGISFLIDDFSFNGSRLARMSGRAFGRCFGTIAGAFNLDRVS